MAKNNPGDILTCDWNPVIGCERYSAGCANCWYLEGIFPWHKRLGIIPEDTRPDQATVFAKRMSVENLRQKGGVVGICQNGDLFWEKVADGTIHRVFDIIEETVGRKRRPPLYLFWTKRAGRMADIVNERYRTGAPDYMAFAASVEYQHTADSRLPHLSRLKGRRVIAVEPMLGPITLGRHLYATEWVVAGSETGDGARPLELDWLRALRDEVKAAGLPLFIKQMGSSHKDGLRELDGRQWNEFPAGAEK